MSLKSLRVIDDDPIVLVGLHHIPDQIAADAKFVSIKNSLKAKDSFHPKTKRQVNEIANPVFVDLNMPIKEGWGFVKKYAAALNPVADKKPILYQVNSSLDQMDHERIAIQFEECGFISN